MTCHADKFALGVTVNSELFIAQTTKNSLAQRLKDYARMFYKIIDLREALL